MRHARYHVCLLDSDPPSEPQQAASSCKLSYRASQPGLKTRRETVLSSPCQLPEVPLCPMYHPATHSNYRFYYPVPTKILV